MQQTDLVYVIITLSYIVLSYESRSTSIPLPLLSWDSDTIIPLSNNDNKNENQPLDTICTGNTCDHDNTSDCVRLLAHVALKYVMRSVKIKIILPDISIMLQAN